MILLFLYLILGIALLYTGAEWLVNGSLSLSKKFGIAPFLMGILVIGLGTSSPELVVSLEAILLGKGEIAVGNIVGSNISNFVLILGTAALIYPVRIRQVRLKMEIFTVILASIVASFMLFNGLLSRTNGIILLIGLFAFFVLLFRKKETGLFSYTPSEQAAKNIPLVIGKTVGGIFMLLPGAWFLIEGATGFADIFELSEGVVGLTIVAIGTSLPELAAIIVASLKRQGALILGGLIGSNVLNLLFVLGVTGTIRPVVLNDIVPTDLALMCISALLVVPALWPGFAFNRWFGGGLLLVYTGYIYSLLLR